jgi:Tannase-like family of unknown function (DUF6351)
MRLSRAGHLVRAGAAIAALVVVSVSAAPAQARHHRTPPRLAISVLSGRADLVSGASALVAIRLPRRTDPRRVEVTVGHRNVSRAFALRRNGHFEGLVGGLAVGRNVLRATLRSGWAAQIILVNHPSGGPVFSGPQLEPWVCQPGALNHHCDQPPTFTYLYRSTDPSKPGFQPYDPANPPSDVAQTTTDAGRKVPFIVRVETGYMDRDQYQISVLFQPNKPWTTFAPQAQFNHKLLITHGASCGVDHQTGTAPRTTAEPTAAVALGRGFMTMSTALDNSGHNCDLPLQAESLVMAKEHIVKSYGTLRYTIGTGCSGGSLAQQWIANAYPGVYQGILPTCSFPDSWSTATQFLDYHLLLAYLTNASKWGVGVAWGPAQMNDVLGGPDGVMNAEVSDHAQFHVAVPTDPCRGTTDAERYNPISNPGGVRCSIGDAAINVFGPEPARLWSPVEKKLGHGFVRLPVDNIGVEYGLAALKAGQITPAEFVDLNSKVGGADIDSNLVPTRIDSSGSPSLARAYRSGMINETNNLNQTAIIDCRGPNPGLFHDAYRAFATRARLDRAHGTHANQLIWEGPIPLVADRNCELNSFTAMDRWLGAVERDHSNKSLSRKVIRDKPSGLRDECFDGAGNKVSNGLCRAGVVNVEGTPRTVAGDAITTDANKCQLRPLRRTDYRGITFTDAEWAKLRQTFRHGVCNFSKPGVAQQPTIPWLTYQDARAHVIYGGRPLGAPPASTEFRVRQR